MEIAQAEKDIAMLYGLLYPFSKVYKDPASGCYMINRELKNICKNSNEMIYR